MRVVLIAVTVAASLWVLGSCAEMGGVSGGASAAARGEMGDIPSTGEPEVGGISEVPNPTPALARLSGTPLRRLERGHEVYMLRCGECHAYMLPEVVDIMDWEDAMPQMIRHAGLARTDEDAVLDYVVAVKKLHGQ